MSKTEETRALLHQIRITMHKLGILKAAPLTPGITAEVQRWNEVRVSLENELKRLMKGD